MTTSAKPELPRVIRVDFTPEEADAILAVCAMAVAELTGKTLDYLLLRATMRKEDVQTCLDATERILKVHAPHLFEKKEPSNG